MKSDNTIYEIPEVDKELFLRMRTEAISEQERIFFEKMEYKEINEFPVSSFDIILSEQDNDDGLYVVKCYSSEYLIGFKTSSFHRKLETVPTSLAEALQSDLYPLFNSHMTLWDWLRERDYSSIVYDHDWEE